MASLDKARDRPFDKAPLDKACGEHGRTAQGRQGRPFDKAQGRQGSWEQDENP